MDNKFFCSICVAGIVFHKNRCLMVRHTYGDSCGKFLIPGGYVKIGETPSQAIKREIFEETKVKTEVRGLISMRFKTQQWCAVFLMDYIEGEPFSDNYENDCADFINLNNLNDYDVTDFSKYLIQKVMRGQYTLIELNDYLPTKYNSKNYELF